MANGDDCVDEENVPASERLDAFGFDLKDYERFDGQGVEFCSHYLDFAARVSRPRKPWKGLAKLLTNSPNCDLRDELLRAFRHEYRHCPELSELLRIVEVHWAKTGFVAG